MKRILKTTSILAVISGLVLIVGGIWGMCFTYQNVARENITTPSDAEIPNAPVRGPLTLKAQADIIREHSLHTSGGLTYAEMPRQIAKLDANGNEVMGPDGKPVMVDNAARANWITATALTTALNLGILSYAFSLFALFLGVAFLWAGFVCKALSQKY